MSKSLKTMHQPNALSMILTGHSVVSWVIFKTKCLKIIEGGSEQQGTYIRFSLFREKREKRIFGNSQNILEDFENASPYFGTFLVNCIYD